MEQILGTGTQKIFSQLAHNTLTVFEIDARRLNFDTTSVNVFGVYDLVDPPFDITYGYSKDHRPDLKQFIVSMLCVERNIPILGTTADGNASDKIFNNEPLTNVSFVMVVTIGRRRQLAKPLKPVQLQYLKALGVTAEIFTAY